MCNGHSVDDVRVFHRACCELAKAGYEVHLFAQGKGSKAYEEKGVVIHPLPEPKNRRERYMRASHVARLASDIKPDLFHVHEPDLLGAALSKAGSRPVIYDVHESYLDVLNDNYWMPAWVKPLARGAWDQWERRLVRRCAAVVTVTETIAKRYRSFNSTVSVVANFPDWQSVGEVPSVVRDGVTCVMAGTLSPSRGLPVIFRALALLKQRGLTVRLSLAGSGTDDYLQSLWDEAESLGVRQQVEYHGTLSKEEALLFQKKGDIGLVTYQPLLYCVNSLPNKLLECMSLGVPVVYSNFPNYREVAETAGAGIMVDPTVPAQIADAIQTLVHNPDLARRMGEAGKRAVSERFNWGVERIKLIRLYHEILSPLDRERFFRSSPFEKVDHLKDAT
ncbi:MAG: glycosyltransferase family 4 protein [Nitrospira sp.]|nr:glycosyltransferase family 4 protein [Nitrospira sp.]